MGKVIRVWVDLLCSKCYSIIEKEIPAEEYDKRVREHDDTVLCDQCDDWVFPN